MTRRRLLVAAVGSGVVLAALPALADVDGGGGSGSRALEAEGEAVRLLERAASAGRRLSWTGTQYVASWRGGRGDTTLVELAHDPVHGSVVTGAAAGDPSAVGVAAVMDPRMVDRLADGYALSVRGPGRCTGRDASVVEARRPDGVVAGRFWVDRDTGMLLRREVFDGEGRRVRSSAFVDLAVDAATAAPVSTERASRPSRRAVGDLREDGWHVEEELPDGFRLLETRLDGEVLHLAYTDGLSTLSLFAQGGELGDTPADGFDAETVDGQPVWVRRTAPERVVWDGGHHVWTLVSDAPESAVRAAVAALPHAEVEDDGVLSRLRRGTARLAGMLNPFS